MGLIISDFEKDIPRMLPQWHWWWHPDLFSLISKDGPSPGPWIPAGQLPFGFANLSKEQQTKLSVEMYTAQIQETQYQISLLNAQLDFLNKSRDELYQSTGS